MLHDMDTIIVVFTMFLILGIILGYKDNDNF